MNSPKGLLTTRLGTKIFMAANAGAEANLNGSKCERKLDKNKSTSRVFYSSLVRFDALSQSNRRFWKKMACTDCSFTLESWKYHLNLSGFLPWF